MSYERLRQSDAAEQDVTVSEPAEIAEAESTGVSGTDTATESVSFRDFLRTVVVGYTTFNAFAGVVALWLKLFGVDNCPGLKLLWVLINCVPVAALFLVIGAGVTYQLASQLI